MTPEFAVDLFKNLLSQGKTHTEIEAMFTKEQIREVLFELHDEHSREFLDLLAIAGMEERNTRDMDKAYELWFSGWTSEPQTPTSQVMSWYWRRPPRTKNRPGRRYLSTDQAYNAMKKQP